MPPLSPQVTAQLTDMLLRQRDDLTGRVRAHGGAPDADPPEIGPLAHVAQPDDMAEAEMIADDEARMVSRGDRELDAIGFALGRLETGEADICTECGARIAPERLLANPIAHTCMRCQREIEVRAGRAHPGQEPTM